MGLHEDGQFPRIGVSVPFDAMRVALIESYELVVGERPKLVRGKAKGTVSNLLQLGPV